MNDEYLKAAFAFVAMAIVASALIGMCI